MLKHFIAAILGMLVMVAALPSQAATLHEQEILELVADTVVQRMQVPRRDVQVVWQDIDAASMVPNIPDGNIRLEISPTARLGGRSSVPIKIMVDGRPFRTIFPRLDVQIFSSVLVAKGRIARGTLVSEADISVERRSIAGMYQAPLTSPGSVLGAETTRDIPAGTMLVAQMFKLPTVVKVGDLVNIVLTEGDLTIVYRGQAKSAGAMGQMIKVMNLETKREFIARVTGPNRVEIKLED